MKYIVYLTTNTKSVINGLNRIYIGVHKTENSDIFDGYIGCGVNIYRPNTYMCPKTPFQYAVKKYGCDAFVRSTLFIFDSADEAYRKESELVNESFINQSHTYNIALGGIGGSLYKQDPKWHTKEVYQFDLKGNLIKKWDSTYDASDFYGIHINTITHAVNDKFILLNCLWSRSNLIDINTFRTKQKKITYLYDLNGKLIREFDSRTDCANYLNCCPQSVSKAINQQSIIKQHYVSETLVDVFSPKPRIQLIKATFYIYNKDGVLLYKCVGKEIMSFLNEYSWKKIHTAINSNRGWYKDFYISTEEVLKIPEKKDAHKKVLVYNLSGHLLSEHKSVKDAMIQYELTSSQITKLLKGLSKHPKYIFKYSK